MTNIEKIRQEIERLKKWSESSKKEWIDEGYNQNAFAEDCRIESFDKLLAFIDSLPEEKPSDDLEEAADEYADKHGFRVPYDGSNNYYDDVDIKASKEGFLAGAEWQKKHSPLPEDTVLFQKGVEEGKRLMMEEAVEGEVGYWNQRGLSIRLDKSLERLGYDMDTKVKIVIVKE